MRLDSNYLALGIKLNNSSMEESFKCKICKRLLVDTVTLACLHRFCLKCVNICYVESQNKSSTFPCPLCKEETPINNTWKKDPLMDILTENQVQTMESKMLTDKNEDISEVLKDWKKRKVEDKNYVPICLTPETDVPKNDYTVWSRGSGCIYVYQAFGNS